MNRVGDWSFTRSVACSRRFQREPWEQAERGGQRLVNVLAVCVLGFAIALAGATAVALAGTHSQAPSKDSDQWQQIDLPSEQFPSRVTSQIKVAIETKGQRMSGLIRIPGGIASNFDTGNGTAIVDLINVGNKATGFTDIRAVEIHFTEVTAGQFFTIVPIGFERD